MPADKHSVLKLHIRELAIPLALLAAVPVAPVLHYFTPLAPHWIFVAGAVAVGILADWVRRATEQLALNAGPAIGGLLNVSFGSLAELILALFVLAAGNVDVVRAQITGSILATSLLGLGLAVVVGSVGRTRQSFDRGKAGQLSTLLILVVIVLMLPAVFDFTARGTMRRADLAVSDEHLSLGVSIVMIVLYGASLIYTLMTRRSVLASEEPESRGSEDVWPVWASIGILVVATAVIALEAHLVSNALEATARSLRISPVFIGVIVLAVVGTASDLFAASWFGHQGKMGLVLNICMGSAIQVALVVAPLLVIGSWLLGQPMTLIFRNPLDLFAVASTAFIVNAIASDGEATWLEGVLLIGVYVLLGLGFFFSAPIA